MTKVIAAYVCHDCEVEGSDIEISKDVVDCWRCGSPAVVTARIVVEE